MTLLANEDPGIESLNGGSGAIHCLLSVANPQVPVLKPTQIEGATLVQRTAPLPAISVTVALFRGDDRVSSNTTNMVGSIAWASTFGPCQGGAYYAAATATLFAPPGYSPSVAVLGVVSNVVPINGAGTAFPPLVCQQGSSSPPPRPPPPLAPVLPGPEQVRLHGTVTTGGDRSVRARWACQSAPGPDGRPPAPGRRRSGCAARTFAEQVPA